MTGTLAAPLLLPLFRRYRTLQFVRSDNDPEFTVNDFNQFIRSADMTYGGRLQHGVEIGGGGRFSTRVPMLRHSFDHPTHCPTTAHCSCVSSCRFTGNILVAIIHLNA